MIDRTLYRRCPGCGDRGDLDHVVACTRARLARFTNGEDARYRQGWRAGVAWFALAATKMRIRRGMIIVARLERAARAMVPLMSDDE